LFSAVQTGILNTGIGVASALGSFSLSVATVGTGVWHGGMPQLLYINSLFHAQLKGKTAAIAPKKSCYFS